MGRAGRSPARVAAALVAMRAQHSDVQELGIAFRQGQVGFRLYCHNILAQAWVDYNGDGGAAWYPGIDRQLLDPAPRRERAFAAALWGQADVICFQEVGASELAALWASEIPRHYHILGLAENAETSACEPNGVLTLLRRGAVDPTLRHEIHQLAGTTAASVVRFRPAGAEWDVVVVNAHLDWKTEGEAQARHVIELLESDAPGGGIAGSGHGGRRPAIVWCGDFNALPGSGVLRDAAAASFQSAFGPGSMGTFFGGKGTRRKRLDHVLYRGGLAVASAEIPSLDGRDRAASNGWVGEALGERPGHGGGDDTAPAETARGVGLSAAIEDFGSDHLPLLVDFEFPIAVASTTKHAREWGP